MYIGKPFFKYNMTQNLFSPLELFNYEISCLTQLFQSPNLRKLE
jgi:hypothetical protein